MSNISEYSSAVLKKFSGRLCSCKGICLCTVVTSLTITSVMIVTIVLNSLSLVVFTRSRELKRHHINYFMVSLTVADLGNGLVAHTTSVVLTWVGRMENLSPGLEPWLPTLIGWTQRLFAFITIHSLAGVCVIKFLSVRFPLRYQSLVTERRCLIAVLVMWVILPILISLNALWNRMYFDFHVFGTVHVELDNMYAFMAAFVIASIVIILCSAYICLVLYRKTRQVSNQGPVLHTFINSFRSAKKVMIMCVVYLMTYIPFVVFAHTDKEISHGWLAFSTYWLMMCGSFLDNAVYLACHRSVQREFRCVLFSKRTLDIVMPGNQQASNQNETDQSPPLAVN